MAKPIHELDRLTKLISILASLFSVKINFNPIALYAEKTLDIASSKTGARKLGNPLLLTLILAQ